MKIRFIPEVQEFPPSQARGFIRAGMAEEVKDEPEKKKEPEVKAVPPTDFTSVAQTPEAEKVEIKVEVKKPEPEKKEDKPVSKRTSRRTR